MGVGAVPWYTSGMDDRSYLHDGEHLLCSMHSSPAMLIRSWMRAIVEGGVAGIVVCAVAFVIASFGFQSALSVWVYVVLVVLGILAVGYFRWKIWTHATFRITSERILLHDPNAIFHSDLKTIKWPQYQESHAGHRTFLDFLFWSRPLHIRYGTADAYNEAHFPSLRYAEDLKHYLDKVDSAVRKNEIAAVNPFVAKPRGKRDTSLEENL